MFERGGACWNASSDIAFWKVRLEMFERDGLYCFERGGHAEMLFRYRSFYVHKQFVAALSSPPLKKPFHNHAH
jgi:hypothetical protein